jgi:hypothetical protein
MHLDIVGASRVYSQTESLLILEHYPESNLFAAVREACSNLYPEREVPIESNIHVTGKLAFTVVDFVEF